MKKSLIAYLSAISALSLTLSQAATIVSFDFSGSIDTANPLTATSALDANVTLSQGIVASGATADVETDRFQAQYNIPSAALTLADSITNGNYLSFIIDANSGFEFDLDGGSLTYRVARPGGAGATNAALFTSIGGFVAGNELADTALDVQGSSTNYNAPTIATPLPSSGYNDITDPFEVRLYFYGGNGFAYIRQFDLDGTVSAVPEPSTAAMFIGVTGLAAVIYRRRKK